MNELLKTVSNRLRYSYDKLSEYNIDTDKLLYKWREYRIPYGKAVTLYKYIGRSTFFGTKKYKVICENIYYEHGLRREIGDYYVREEIIKAILELEGCVSEQIKEDKKNLADFNKKLGIDE